MKKKLKELEERAKAESEEGDKPAGGKIARAQRGQTVLVLSGPLSLQALRLLRMLMRGPSMLAMYVALPFLATWHPTSS